MESSIQCYPKVCMALQCQCHKIKLLSRFEYSTLWPTGKKFTNFWGEEMGKHGSVCPNFSWPFRVRKRKFFVKVFRSTNLPFPKIKPRKFKFLTVTPAPVRKKFTNFGEEKLETTIWFLPKLFIVLYYHKTKLLRQFLVQAIYI